MSVAPENGALRKKRRSMERIGPAGLIRGSFRQCRGIATHPRSSRRSPARFGALDDPVGEGRQTTTTRTSPSGSSRRGGRGPATPGRRSPEGDRRESDGDVDPEDGPPSIGRQALRPRIGPESHAHPDRQRPRRRWPAPARSRNGEHVRDDRHRYRVQHRAADGLHDPEGDKHPNAWSPGCTATSPSRTADRPIWKCALRPSRSAIEPESRSRLARTSAYASIVHCKPEREACKSRRIEGRARFTTVCRVATISRLKQQIAKNRHAAAVAQLWRPLHPTVLASRILAPGARAARRPDSHA